MFSTGLLVSAGVTITAAIVEKSLDELGYMWLGATLRIIIPLASMLLGVYFLEHNPMLRWLK
jgi:hypothetical protein